jgi:hypothetical protein
LVDRRAPISTYFLFILTIIALLGLGWVNYRFAEQKIGGTDFLIQWVAIRSLVTDGLNPYSDTVTRDIQTFAGEFAIIAPERELRFTSPLYTGIIVLPFVLIEDYDISHALWMTVQQVAIIATVMFSVRLTGWKPGFGILLLLTITITLGYYGLVAFISGDLIIWVGLLICLALLAIRGHRDEVAGGLLALATIKPIVVILLIVYIIWWTFSHRRRMVLFWLLGILGLMIIAGMLLVPDWLIQYLRTLWNYPEYLYTVTPGSAFTNWWPGLGSQMGWLMTIILVGILLVEWWLARGKEFRWFLWTASLTLIISTWVGIPTQSVNILILSIPMILIYAVWEERWGKSGRWVILLIMFLIFVAGWLSFYRNFKINQMHEPSNLLFILPLILLIGMYWIRWWATRPPRLFVEEIRSRE